MSAHPPTSEKKLRKIKPAVKNRAPDDDLFGGLERITSSDSPQPQEDSNNNSSSNSSSTPFSVPPNPFLQAGLGGYSYPPFMTPTPGMSYQPSFSMGMPAPVSVLPSGHLGMFGTGMGHTYPPPPAGQSYPPTAAGQGYPPTAPHQGFPPTAAAQAFSPAAGQSYPSPASSQGYPLPAASQNYLTPPVSSQSLNTSSTTSSTTQSNAGQSMLSSAGHASHMPYGMPYQQGMYGFAPAPMSYPAIHPFMMAGASPAPMYMPMAMPPMMNQPMAAYPQPPLGGMTQFQQPSSASQDAADASHTPSSTSSQGGQCE